MKMFIAGQWVDKPQKIDVRSPFDNTVVDTVPKADVADVEKAVAGAVEGAKIMRAMPAYERYRILAKAARLMFDRREQLARIISQEEGKILGESLVEAARAAETIELSAEEAKRIYGEVLPLDAASHGTKKFGFTLRVPCGVVACITPFNFPLNLPCHKVGPALAAGNSVILKPASDTPLSSLALVEILLEAGVPPPAIACITGSGSSIGDALAGDPRIRKISFTGSQAVGEHIMHKAGLKRITMELGSNCPVIVMDDADLNKAAEGIVASGYSNAGQVCISAQRVLAVPKVYSDLLDVLKPKVAALRTGNPLDSQTKMGPMIRQGDAERVQQWVGEAVSSGARIVTGGGRQGTMHEPTLVADVSPKMRISCDELFGPAVAVTAVDDIEQAISLANDTRYGLSAAIFTENIGRALRFAREADSGNIHINWGPQWRADFMPYGGLKDSGMGKEGPKYAIQEMTELKMVVVHGV
ncbi:MAG TPA: aldehyde dehydrogenase family protein [Pirellulales bacterium]|nr:aldehyde dehydrogenase family protein [Pirellulales bacterium]